MVFVVTAAAIFGFIVGAAVMLYRVISLGGRPRDMVECVILALAMSIGGIVTALLAITVSTPIVAFAHRVDALERQCPPGTRSR